MQAQACSQSGHVLPSRRALGIGIPGVIGAAHLKHTGRIWKLMGYPTHGPVEFAEWGVPTTIPLILGFVGVCAAEVAVGTLLWRRTTRRMGRILALELPPLGAARTVLVIVGWIAEPRKRRLCSRWDSNPD